VAYDDGAGSMNLALWNFSPAIGAMTRISTDGTAHMFPG
jgi:hypothetical protein